MDTLSSTLSEVEGEMSRIYMALLDLRENTHEIRDIARRYPQRISAFELGQEMNEILDQMTRFTLTSDMINDMTVHWLKISRATALSRCYSDSFSAEVQDFVLRAQHYPGSGLIEGPFGSLELFTLDMHPSGGEADFLIYASLNKNELVQKLLPVDEGSLAVVLGDGWAIVGNDVLTASTQRYVPTEENVVPPAERGESWLQMTESIRQQIGQADAGSFPLED